MVIFMTLKFVAIPMKRLKKSEFAFVCSGTATLEAALVGVPFVLAYKAKRLIIGLLSNL